MEIDDDQCLNDDCAICYEQLWRLHRVHALLVYVSFDVIEEGELNTTLLDKFRIPSSLVETF
ncbi:hypothetical protein RND71_022294 [Anisodus tanguticus]|uniref:Uncharacterized protein n=1 Tax=Anisodus tanguticus TaxID=243964 RepID=A0AAE1RY99_9SOLA|nr:hypothetical protein RND71_022294 [Anisodus tanguticus]